MPEPITKEPTLLEQLKDLRAVKVDEWEDYIVARRVEKNEFEARATKTDEEVAAFATAEESFRTGSQKHEQGIADIDDEIRQHEKIIEQRRLAAEAHKGLVQITAEPMTYNAHNAKEVSFFRDMAATHVAQVAFNGTTPEAARERMQRHNQEMDVELPRRAADRERRANARADEAERSFTRSVDGVGKRGLDSPFEKRVNPNRTDGQGGYFVPPVWLIDEYIAGLRAGRVAAGLCRQMDLPEGTDSINIPKLSTLTQVGVQGVDGGAVTSQDFTDTAVTANVKTLAGQEDVAIQLVEQSPGQIIDKVIMEDLMADYNRLVDRQVVYGNGTNSSSLNGGQLLGIYPSTNWTGTQTVTWTSSTIYGPGFNMVLAALASKVSYNRFDLKNFSFLLHGRRWFWFASALDGASGTSGRPVVNVNENGPFNVSVLADSPTLDEGFAGTTSFGAKVYIDANVPTTDNGSGALSGTYDVAIGAKWDDLWLFEGEPRFRVLPEILSGTLELRYQTYNYVAFLARYGQSIALASGTGFGAPASIIDSSVTF
jgi:hypothetical protein